MRPTKKLIFTLLATMGPSFTAFGFVSQLEAGASTAINVQEANPTITITSQPGNDFPFAYDPAQISGKVGQPITIVNNDQNSGHSVTAKDGTFSVDVPPKSTVTLTVSKAGSFAYDCTYHPAQHNPATINVS